MMESTLMNIQLVLFGALISFFCLFFFFLWLFFYVLFIYGYSFTFFMCETHCIPNQAFFDSLSSSVKRFFLPQQDGWEKFFKSGNCQAFPWLLFYES